MPTKTIAWQTLTCRPVTPERWPDVEALFGPRGACGGCWCMWWFQTGAEFDELKGEPNRLAFRALVESGAEPGLLVYADGQPAGWCAVGPRERYPRLERSRTLKRVDELPVWSIVCLFVARPYRRQGLTLALLQAAVEQARQRGAAIVEGYPVEPRQERMPDAFAWTGLASTYRRAGFVEVARRAPTRPIMRYVIAADTPGVAPAT